MHTWDIEQYLKFKKERTTPSVDLIARIDIDNPKKILDIGCGPGNSTYELKKRFPNAYILGIDSSLEMINDAKETYDSINFLQMDAKTELGDLICDFDIVFSNACIQWIDDHYSLIPNMFKLLKVGGVLAVQLPYNHKEPVKTKLNELVTSLKWKTQIKDERQLYQLEENEYFKILSNLTKEFSLFQIIYYHDMPNQEAIIEWFKGSGLKPYLDMLKKEDQEEFLDDYLKIISPSYPSIDSNHTILKFPRLFFTAKKTK